jgi:hypothetical protein
MERILGLAGLYTWRVKAKVNLGWNAAADVSGWKPADIVWTSDGGLAEGSHAKARRKGRRRFSVSSLAQVVQLPKTFFCNEGVLECSGLTELWMGIEHVDGKSKAVSSHRTSKKQGSGLNFLIQISNFRFPHSPLPAPKPSTIDSRLSTQ